MLNSTWYLYSSARSFGVGTTAVYSTRYLVSSYNSSMVSTLFLLWCWYNNSIVSILVPARVLCAGHALLIVTSYGSAVTELKTLCHRSSRACSSYFVALKACSRVLVVLVQQYAVRELTLCYRSLRALVLLCTCVLVVSIIYSLLLSCSCVLVVLEQQYGISTRSCSVALKAYAVVHLTLCHRSSRARMLLRTCGVGAAVRYLYSLLLRHPEGILLCTYGVFLYRSSIMISIPVQSSYG